MAVVLFPQVRYLLSTGVHPMNDKIPEEVRNDIHVKWALRKLARRSLCLLYTVRTLLALIRELVSGDLKDFITEISIYMGDFTYLIPNNMPFNVYTLAILLMEMTIEINQYLDPGLKLMSKKINMVLSRDWENPELNYRFNDDLIIETYKEIESKNTKYNMFTWLMVVFGFLLHAGKLVIGKFYYLDLSKIGIFNML